MASRSNKRVAWEHKKSARIKRKKHKKVKKTIDDTDYASYLARAKKREIPEKDILTYPEYLSVQWGLRAKGQSLTGQQLVTRQIQDAYTNKEVSAQFKAHKRLWPEQNLTRKKFIANKSWEDLENYAEVLKAQYRAEGNDKKLVEGKEVVMTDKELLGVAWRHMMSPSLKGVDGE